MSRWVFQAGRKLGQAAIPLARQAKRLWNKAKEGASDPQGSERELGAFLARQLKSALPPAQNPALQPRLEAILRRLAGALGDKNREFAIEAVSFQTPRAVALPGGFLFLGESLAASCGGRDDALAFLIAHEMAHAVRRDAVRKLMSQTAVRAAGAALRSGPLAAWVRGQGLSLLETAHSKECEWAADAFAADLVRRAGWGLDGALAWLETIDAAGPESGAYLASHPPPRERLERLKRLAPGTAPSP